MPAIYPQYFAARKLLANVLIHQKPIVDGKGGTYFGTTGRGKSFIMLFLTRLIMHEPSLNSPTVLQITDHSDLDDQLSRQFLNSKKFYRGQYSGRDGQPRAAARRSGKDGQRLRVPDDDPESSPTSSESSAPARISPIFPTRF